MKNVNPILSCILGLSLGFGVASAALAKDAAQAQGPDAHFLSKLHQANLNEVEMGKLAKSQGQSPEIKSFGQRLIDDHSKADGELKQLAKQDKIELTEPFEPQSDVERRDAERSQRTMSKLRGLKGRQFDEAFREFSVNEHRKDIDDVSATVPNLKEENVKRFARSVLPVLRTHERIALSLPKTGRSGMAGEMGGSS